MTDPPLVPVDVLWPTDSRGEAYLSPDGRWVAHLHSVGGTANAVVRAVPGGADRTLTQFTEGHGVEQLRWAADSQHLLLTWDTGGDEDYRLGVADVGGGPLRILVGETGVRALLLGVDLDQPTTVAVGLNLEDPRFHDVYHVDVVSGARVKVAANPGFTRWALDSRLHPRGGVRAQPGGGATLEVEDGGGWRTVHEADADDAMPLLFDLYPIRFDDGGDRLYFVGHHGGDTLGLVCLDLDSGKQATVAGGAGGDLMWVTFHPSTGEPVAATVVRARSELVACSDDVRADVDELAQRLVGDLQVTSVDATGALWTVSETRDTSSPQQYLYDRRSRALDHLYGGSPGLDAAPLCAMEPASFTARDGLEIPVYLTFPHHRREQLPTVVMVHGGPANRYFWGYHPQVQFFADRGYLVVQVNFRGSLGYGRGFMAAGDGEWARAMHHDVVDAVHWAVASGLADRERVGMWGTSYGGYETLITVSHDPDLVRCAVPVVAPTSLVTLVAEIPDYWQAERAYFARVLGDLDDEANLWERSPLRLADRIKAPLLLVYGASDPRVKVSQAEELVARLQETGLDHELMVFPDEGHNLAYTMTPSHRVAYAAALESFLARHLGGRRSETSP